MKTGADTNDTAILPRMTAAMKAAVMTPPALPPGHVPSCYQQAVYDNVASGKGHTVVEAFAGSGKTTTMLIALGFVPRGSTIVMVAFNKSIATELAGRAPRGVDVKTLHSHGFSAVRRALPGVTVEGDKTWHIVDTLCGGDYEHAAGIVKLVGVAKDTLTALRLVRENLATKIGTKSLFWEARNSLEALDALVDTFEIDCPDDDADRARFVEAAARVLVRSAQMKTKQTKPNGGDPMLFPAEKEPETSTLSVIDFSDMCWLPIVHNFRVWAYDRVFMDETQDMNPCQIALVLKMVRPGGRICAVGDEKQELYAFRGADATMSGLIETLGATVLQLSITYRCPRAVVRLAQLAVPGLEAAPNAIEGVVTNANKDYMLTHAEAGDMIISRSNGPLIEICLALMVRGKRASIMGRNVGEGLARLITRSKAKSLKSLDVWMAMWAAKEAARLLKKKRDPQIAFDQKSCIDALCEDAESIAEVLERANKLFSDNEGGKITLGTTHKLKGLEADRVWMLEGTYRRQRGGAEEACWYVAVTRAKKELILTSLPKKEERQSS